MTRWSQERFEAYIAKSAKWRGGDSLNDTEQPDSGKEARLQLKCERWLRDHGYPYVHDRSRKKNRRGIPDLICFLPEGRVVVVELKAKDGRLSFEQTQTLRMLKYLKHEVHEVRSFKRFLQIMEATCQHTNEPAA